MKIFEKYVEISENIVLLCISHHSTSEVNKLLFTHMIPFGLDLTVLNNSGGEIPQTPGYGLGNNDANQLT